MVECKQLLELLRTLISSGLTSTPATSKLLPGSFAIRLDTVLHSLIYYNVLRGSSLKGSLVNGHALVEKNRRQGEEMESIPTTTEATVEANNNEQESS